MVIEVMEECTPVQVIAVGTTLSMHQRFTRLAQIMPSDKSTHEGPLFNGHLQAIQNQHIFNAVVQHIGRVQELQQRNFSRAGSMPRSRAGSMSRYGSEYDMPLLVRSNSWGNLSQANSVGNVSQRSGQSGRSHGGQSNRSRATSFVGPDLKIRLQMRNAWMRNMRTRARGRGNYTQRNQYRNQYQQRGRWQPYNQPRRPWQWGWQPGRQQWWRQGVARSRQAWGRQRPSVAQSNMPPLTPRGRAGQFQENGRGRGRGGQNTGVSRNNMPALKTREQLDKELDEYMASTPAMLDKQLEDYLSGADRD